MKIKVLLIIALCSVQLITAQVGIGTTAPDPSSILEIKSTNKGFLPPRMDTGQRDAIAPVAGLILYNTDDNCLNYYNGTAWINLCAGGDSNVIVTPPTFPEGTLNAYTKTCFDVALSNDFVGGSGSLALRALRQADFTTTDTNTQTITISSTVAITDLLVQVVDVDGNIVSSITQPAVTALDPAGTTSTTATIQYKTTLNATAFGLTASTALSAGIYITYKEGGVDKQNVINVKIKDSDCASQTSPGVTVTNHITSDGRIFNTGESSYVGRPSAESDQFNNVILPALADGSSPKIVSITSGDYHSVAISEEGKVYGWGGSTYGQLGLNGTYNTAVQITGGLPPTQKIISATANKRGTLLLSEDNKLYAAGRRWMLGIPGTGAEAYVFEEVDLGHADVIALNGGVAPVPVQIYAAGYQSFFIDDQGNLWGTGRNAYASLGSGDTVSQTRFVKYMSDFPAGAKVLQVVCTEYNTAVLLDTAGTSGGKVFVAGATQSGIISTTTVSGNMTTFQELKIDGDAVGNIGTIVSIYLGRDAGNYSSLFLLDTNNKLYAKGRNAYGSLGIGNTSGTYQTTFKELDLSNLNGEKILKVKSFYWVTTITTENGKIYTTGPNYYYNLLANPNTYTLIYGVFTLATQPNSLIHSFVN